MLENLFVNRRLQATAIADGGREVHVWVDQLAGILELGVTTDHEVYDLLALCGKLRRVRSELIHAAGGDTVIDEAEQLVAQRGAEFADRALCIPNPQAWLVEAAKLEASYVELVDASERAAAAEQLLDDLDDAELVLAVARKVGRDDPELASQLEQCTTWLAEHADLFLAISVYVQGIGLALRGDLEEFDYDLVATAIKFADVLRVAEQAERQLALANVVPLPPHVANALNEAFSQNRPLWITTPAPTRSQQTSQIPAADTSSSSDMVESVFTRVWENVASVVRSLRQLGTALVEFSDPPGAPQPVPVLGSVVAAPVWHLVSRSTVQPAASRSSSGNFKDISLWYSFGADALKRFESEHPEETLSVETRDVLVRQLGEQILKERLPWAGERLRVVRVPNKTNPGAAKYSAQVDVCAEVSGGKGRLRIVLDTETGESATVCLGKDCPEDLLSMTMGDTLPSDWEALIPRLIIDGEVDDV